MAQYTVSMNEFCKYDPVKSALVSELYVGELCITMRKFTAFRLSKEARFYVVWCWSYSDVLNLKELQMSYYLEKSISRFYWQVVDIRPMPEKCAFIKRSQFAPQMKEWGKDLQKAGNFDCLAFQTKEGHGGTWIHAS